MNQELNHCLHCGGEARIGYAAKYGDGSKEEIKHVVCTTCYCQTKYYDTEAEAIAAWNERAERECEFNDTGCAMDTYFRCAHVTRSIAVGSASARHIRREHE